ncbi:hypothetical protein ACW5DW_17120 [Luteimonas sp. A482]
MRLWQKILAAAVLVPTLVIAGYIGYLWATYIDETITSGAAHGFTIGASKQDALASVSHLSSHPDAVVYVSHGPRAGDNFSIVPSPAELGRLQEHDQWVVLLDGNDKFFNSVRLTFRDGALAEIHRHRKHFELP